MTDVFLDQNRVNVCEYAVKSAPHESFVKVRPEGVQDRKGGGMEGKLWKSSEVNTRAVSRGQNELIGEFKIVGSNLMVLGGRLWSTCTLHQELNGSW